MSKIGGVVIVACPTCGEQVTYDIDVEVLQAYSLESITSMLTGRSCCGEPESSEEETVEEP